MVRFLGEKGIGCSLHVHLEIREVITSLHIYNRLGTGRLEDASRSHEKSDVGGLRKYLLCVAFTRRPTDATCASAIQHFLVSISKSSNIQAGQRLKLSRGVMVRVYTISSYAVKLSNLC